MKVKFHLPRASEATIEYDPKSNMLIITPIFYRSDSSQNLAHVMVEGDGGASRKYLLEVTGNKGQIRAIHVAPVQSGFDKPSKEDEKQEESS